MKKVELRTERLLLRVPVVADVEQIATACQDPDIQRWVPIPVPYNETDALSYVRDYSDRGWVSGNCCTWAIVHDGHFAGAIGLDGIAGEEPTIGYWMAPASRRNGLLSEALPAVLDFGMSAAAPHGLGLNRVRWHAYAGNSASARIAQRAGFRFEGTIRDGATDRSGVVDDWVASIQRGDALTEHPWPILSGV